MIALAGSWRISPPRTQADARPYLEWLTLHSRTEPRCLEYMMAFDLFDADCIHTFAVYADEDALADHRRQPWGSAEWRAFSRDFRVEDFEVRQFDVQQLGAADPANRHSADDHGGEFGRDDHVMLLGGSWRISDRLTAADTLPYNRWITAGVAGHEFGHLLYLNGADLFDEHRINSICILRDEAALLEHRRNRWVSPEWFRFGDLYGLRDFNMTHYGARHLGATDPNDASGMAIGDGELPRRTPRWFQGERNG